MKSRTFIIIIIFTLLIGSIFYYSQKLPLSPTLRLTSIDKQIWQTNNPDNKITLITFWATNCLACIEEIPFLLKTQQQFGDKGYKTIMVSMFYDSPSFVLQYVKKNRLPFFITVDVDNSIAKAFGGIDVTPTSFLINKKGEIIQKIVGRINIDQLNKYISEHIRE